MHRPALDGPGADERDLHHEVVEALGPQPRQRGHLRAALHLEHADGVGRAQQRVHLGLLRDGGEVDVDAFVLAHEVDGEVQHREHAQAEQVELHQPGGRAVVLVPLEHRAVLHARPLDRAALDERAVGHHHPARVDAEVAREVEHLLGEVERELRDRRAPSSSAGSRTTRGAAATPPVDPLGERVGVTRREAHGLRHLPQRRARPVGDHVGDLRGALAAVLVVDVLDHLLTPLVLDVEVDVGGAVALEREEALEQQAERDRVGLGDAERVTDRAVRRAPPALAVDVVDAAELDDVDQHEEVAGEVELLDHVELVRDLAHRLLVVRVGRRVADARAACGELTQPGHLGVAGGNVVIGELGRGEAQVERARARDVDGALHRTRPAREAALLLRRAAEVRERRRPGASRRSRRANGATAPRRARWRAGAARAWRSARCWWRHVDAGRHRHPGQRVVAVTVERVAVVPQLHQHAVAPEAGDELVERGARRGAGRRAPAPRAPCPCGTR